MRHWDGPGDRRGYHHGNLKEALVEAARRFIAERGLGGFTLADAAKLVGVTPAALYRHFSGRDALVAEVAERGFDELARRLAWALRGSGTPLERFTRMGEAYLAFAEEEPGFYAAMFSARPEESGPAGPWGRAAAAGGAKGGRTGPWGQAAGDEPAGPETPGAFNLLVNGLMMTFPEGLNGVDPRFLALQVWALAHGLATLSAAGQLPEGAGLPDKHALLRAGVLAIVNGAAADRGPA
ncbi:MAG TPA: TetR/AcrR family transcriptional regulator [Microvirga sp.]|jgi:AcrR family transcriptional regulator|nr:TetR/AcrR family transcriptional regulator [Microvirga sp.]